MAFEVAVQTALHVALSGVPLQVYDVAPQAVDGGSNGAFPYVEVGSIVVGEWDTKLRLGFDFVARVHTYSRSGSMKECKTIQGQIYDRLHLGDISITGYSLTLLRRETSNVISSKDSLTHGVCEYRGLVTKD